MADLFSSSKGPGVIGALLGLVVLAGFCGLGMAVFDGRLNGSLDSERKERIARNNSRIETLKRRIPNLRRQGEVAEEYVETARALKAERERKAKLEAEAAAEEGKIANVRAKHEDYQSRYRVFARERMEGRKLEEIVIDGKTYKIFIIEEVTSRMMKFKHQNGSGRVHLALTPLWIRKELDWQKEEEPVPAGPPKAPKLPRGAAVRIRDLEFQIPRIRAYIERQQKEVEENTTQQIKNERGIEKLKAQAAAEWEQFEIDKQEGRGGTSRADDRALDKEKKAAGLAGRNRGLDRENLDLLRDIQAHEGKIERAEREIAELRAKVQRDPGKEPPK